MFLIIVNVVQVARCNISNDRVDRSIMLMYRQKKDLSPYLELN